MKKFRLLLVVIAAVLIWNSMPCNASDWPHWRGPDRNGISPEKSGWENGSWNLSGPIWKQNLGAGAASPLVVGDNLYCIGWKNGFDTVWCLESSSGKIQWEQKYQSPEYGRFAKGDQGFYRGATATPEFDPATGILYTMSCDGFLRAHDTKEKGKHLWSFNLYDKYGMKRRPQITSRKNTLRDYGYTCSPLVLGNQLIIEAGDRKGGSIKGFDKLTGKQIWSSENCDPAGHSGALVPMTVDGVPCVAVATSWNALVVRVDGKDAGKTVAEFEWKTDFSNTIAGVAVEGQDLLISSRYNQMAMVRLHITLKNGAREVWRNRYPTGVCTPVIDQGNIYFANKGIHCVDFKTGKLKWVGGKIDAAGSCYVTSDDRLIVWGNSGDLFLVESASRSPGKCIILDERKNVFRNMAWPHVVGAGGRIFCKTVSGDLACFSLSGEKPNLSNLSSSSSSSAAGSGGNAFTPGDLNNWLEKDPDLVIGWKRGAGVSGCIGHPRRVRLTSRGRAKFEESGKMDVSGGAYQVAGASSSLLAACKKNNRLSVEMIFETANLNQRGPARILSFSRDPYHRNFTIGQERDRITLRLRTPATGLNGSKPELSLCKIKAGQPVHILMTYQPGETIVYLNGTEVLRSDRVQGDFSNWDEEQQFIIGDEWSEGSRDWAGKIYGFAIFQRILSPKEAHQRFEIAKAK